MQIFRISDADRDWLEGEPETAMGLQVVRLRGSGRSARLVMVVGGCTVFDRTRPSNKSARDLLSQDWMVSGKRSLRLREFEEWLKGLDPFDGRLSAGKVILRFAAAGSSGGLTPAATTSAAGFGHLPFSGQTGQDDAFYRWEPFPQSRRVQQKSLYVSPGTFTAPSSELPFVASGFGAVGRFALPSLSPANWRWEVRPPAGSNFRCGASVPLFGQSGGGVEVEFTPGFANVGPIADPVVLSAL